MQSHEEVDFERLQVKLHEWMREQADGLGDKFQMDCFDLSSRFDSAWFVDSHE